MLFAVWLWAGRGGGRGVWDRYDRHGLKTLSCTLQLSRDLGPVQAACLPGGSSCLVLMSLPCCAVVCCVLCCRWQQQ